MILTKEFEALPENIDTDIKMLIYVMLNKDSTRRPTIFDLA